MYLAGPDTRRLNRIDRALCGADPRLAGMFAIFTRLAAGEGMPRAERLASARTRLLALLAVPVVVAVTLATAAAGGIAAAARRAVAAGRHGLGIPARPAGSAQARAQAVRE